MLELNLLQLSSVSDTEWSSLLSGEGLHMVVTRFRDHTVVPQDLCLQKFGELQTHLHYYVHGALREQRPEQRRRR